jgi:hypothetical protein
VNVRFNYQPPDRSSGRLDVLIGVRQKNIEQFAACHLFGCRAGKLAPGLLSGQSMPQRAGWSCDARIISSKTVPETVPKSKGRAEVIALISLDD